ncbi:hypothetical protein GCM10011322_27250 [Salinarimonas ramus]|uniref:Uncharacterized protein n=1 Tax=Salinarimonas ramus TaxID=690164 RepID=A0A917QAF9_9HYPH|nr:hypothetical protein GCM10011322_27250 [Salinarimonas ramus]
MLVEARERGGVRRQLLQGLLLAADLEGRRDRIWGKEFDKRHDDRSASGPPATRNGPRVVYAT